MRAAKEEGKVPKLACKDAGVRSAASVADFAGMVNITIASGHASMGASWFTQTSYGAAFWQATAYLRSFRYVARPTRY